MKIHIFSVDKKSGKCENVENIDDVEDKNQVLLVQGIDSGFHIDFGVEKANGEWVYSGYYIISKYFNSEEKPDLSIVVGKYTVLSIHRVVPAAQNVEPIFEFEFNIKNNETGENKKQIFTSYSEGFSKLAQD